MVIVYTSISCALACGGNKTCETLRCWRKSQCEVGVVPINNEDVSPNKVNSFRPRYTINAVGQPAGFGEACYQHGRNKHMHMRNGRGDWRERASKEQLQYLGDPFHGIKSEVDDMRGRRGNNNPLSLWQGKSEWLVRTSKRGNACGVKELRRHRVYRMERRPA